MDDTEDDARYPPNPSSSSYPVNFHHTFSSSHRPKLPVRNPSSAPAPIVSNFYSDEEYEDDAEEDDPDDEEEEEEEENGTKRVVPEAADEDDDDDDDDEDEDDDDDDGGDGYLRVDEEDESENPGKRRRVEKSALGFEFAPRAKAPSAPTPFSKPSFGGGSSRNSPADWSEQATLVLLDAWGDRFLQLGRKSLRSDEWVDVAKRVSQASKTGRTDAQCRNRLDTLKKKYKKEKTRLTETGNSTSKWVYFKKMEMLMSSPPPRHPGLACGLDSGEYVFMNPRVYLNRSNGLDEMRDSPGNSEPEEVYDDESDGLPPRKARTGVPAEENGGPSSSSFRLLADSIQKFGQIYEKIENSKRQQMMELEKMRIEFHRDLEVQKRQILERAQAEIAKIRQGDDEEIDVSVENNTSG